MPNIIQPGSPERTGFYINAALYGAPNFAIGSDGKRQFQTIFDMSGKDRRLQTAYVGELRKIGEAFAPRVLRRFRERHDRTGRTARTFQGGLHTEEGAVSWLGNTDIAVYSVRIGGGVGFVINPIGTHDIPQTAFPGRPQFLYHDLTSGGTQTWGWRSEDFMYHGTNNPLAFEASAPVTWFQGGEQSFSPDTSWYDDDAKLPMEAFRALALLAARVELIWGEQSFGNFISLTRPMQNSLLFPTPTGD